MMNAACPPAPNRRAQQRKKRRQKFVAAAERLFLRCGYAGTSVNEVVRLAGGSLATLYDEFGTKEKLFEAVISERVSRAFGAPGATSEAGCLEERLRQLATRIHDRMLTTQSLALYRLAVAEGPRFAGLREAVLVAGMEAFLARLAEYFTTLARGGELLIEDGALAARRFLALVQGQHQFAAACGDLRRFDAATRAAHVEDAVTAFLAIYLARRGTTPAAALPRSNKLNRPKA
jgi:AcrR family transcriptional regulator